MKLLRLAVVAAGTLLFITACGKETEIAAVIENDLLAYVPADTPYLAANLEPTPVEIVDAYLAMMQPVLDTMQANLKEALAGLDEEEEEDQGARVALAVLQEFDGKLNRAGLENLGIDISSHKVVYGMDVFPVFRFGLSDPGALQATFDRIQANAGFEFPQVEYQGIKYWRMTDDSQQEAPAAFYMAILGDHLALTVFPPLAEEEFLPAFLGLEMPADSDAGARLAGLNREHGYTPYGTGILELETLTELFLDPDSIVARVMAESGEHSVSDLTPECAAEIRQLVSHTPRMVAGTTELTTHSVAYQYRVETGPSLAGELVGMVADIPAVAPISERIMELSFGMRFGPVRDFLRSKAEAITNAPFKCEHFQELNDGAAEALTQLNQPMPPFVNNFQGLRISLSELTMTTSIPENARGLLAVHVEKPEMFVGMAQMFLPDLSELNLAPGEAPIPLPANLVPLPDTVAFAAMSDSAIGLSIGDGEEAGLSSFLEQKAGPEGTFLSVSYDVSTYLEYTDRIGDQWQNADYEDHTGAMEMAEAMQEAFKSVADRSHSTFRFTPGGLVVDGKMTFK